MKSHLYKGISSYLSELDIESIPAQRKKMLEPLIAFIQRKSIAKEDIRIQFICIHNSRRSLFTQVWAQTLSSYFGLNAVSCYSGGMERTALFPKVVETFQNSGFKVDKISEGNNPIYSIKYSANGHPIIGFSKKIVADFNPTSDFLAVMTCSQADEACPFVPGAEQRISLPYADPKAFDNTDQQIEKYKECSRQVATELFYVFDQLIIK